MKSACESPLIVGFGHRRRVGKDTLAGMVRDKLRAAEVSVFRDAFAWNLKQTARQMFRYAGLADDSVYENRPELRETILPAIGMSPRDLWIAIGNGMREIVPDVWIRNVLDNPAYDCSDGADRVVLISDLRYPNELEAIRSRGGMVVKVTRNDIPESGDVADSALAGMPDESWDRVIRNNLDLGFLEQQAAWLASGIRNRLNERRVRA